MRRGYESSGFFESPFEISRRKKSEQDLPHIMFRTGKLISDRYKEIMKTPLKKENKSLRKAAVSPGLTLLEILIALVVFSFASLYISRTVTRILKQKKKTEREIKDRRISANVLEMLQRDLKGVFLHFDMNFHFSRHTQEELAERKNERRGGVPPQNRNFLNPQFDFFGKENLMTFTTLVPLAGGGEPRLVKVSYFVKSCADRETGKTSACLVRGTSRHWKDREDTENQRNHILLRGLKRVRFSYRHEEKKEWVKNWNFQTLRRKGMERPGAKTVFLPLSVQADIEWEEGSRRFFHFPVSHPFLRAFRPGAPSPLIYLNVSERNSPQEAPPRPSKTGKSPAETPKNRETGNRTGIFQ